MKRDFDIVRAILMAAEDADPGQVVEGIAGVDELTFAGHVDLMLQAGLVDAAVARSASLADAAVCARVQRLTWDGHDFLDAIRDETVWSKTKSCIADTAGAVTFELVKTIAVGFLQQAIKGALTT